jgi:hypothetical protein
LDFIFAEVKGDKVRKRGEGGYIVDVVVGEVHSLKVRVGPDGLYVRYLVSLLMIDGVG